ADGTPPDAPSRFEGTGAPGLAPTPIYPADGVVVPPNLGSLTFQWHAAAGAAQHRLRLSGDGLDLQVYTTRTEYTLTGDEWRWMAETSRGARVTVSVASVAASGPAGASAAPARTIGFSRADVRGALYYFAIVPPSNGSTWRFDFGQGAAEEF